MLWLFMIIWLWCFLYPKNKSVVFAILKSKSLFNATLFWGRISRCQTKNEYCTFLICIIVMTFYDYNFMVQPSLLQLMVIAFYSLCLFQITEQIVVIIVLLLLMMMTIVVVVLLCYFLISCYYDWRCSWLLMIFSFWH